MAAVRPPDPASAPEDGLAGTMGGDFRRRRGQGQGRAGGVETPATGRAAWQVAATVHANNGGARGRHAVGVPTPAP